MDHYNGPAQAPVPTSFKLIRSKANAVNDTQPAAAADKTGETIDITPGKSFKYMVLIQTAADATCTDGTCDIQWCEYEGSTTIWTPGTSSKRVGVGCTDVMVMTTEGGRLWPMVTNIAGTAPAAAAKVKIYAWPLP